MEKKKGYENITNYVNHRFRDDKNPIQPYKNGVSMIVSPQKENGFRIGESGSPIPLADKTTGRINWAEINKLLNLISKNK